MKNKHESKNMYIIVIYCIAVVLLFVCVYFVLIAVEVRYNNAVRAMENGDFDKARTEFMVLGDYKDSEEMFKETIYRQANEDFELGRYSEAANKFSALKRYKDSRYMSGESKRQEENMIKEAKYQEADTLFKEGHYSQAYDKFSEIPGYKDANAKLVDICETADRTILEQIDASSVKGTVTFGTVGIEPIGWIVLTKEEDRALLISDDVLWESVYAGRWETDELRYEMNNDFLNTSFTDSAREYIMPVTLENSGNPQIDRPAEEPTVDKVFMISIEEARTYFDSDDERRVNGIDKRWYLRNPGGYVTMLGEVKDDNQFCLGVRPAMYISLQ